MQKLLRSAIFKLTVAYAGMVVAICLIFSAVFYQIAVNELHTGIYNQYSQYSQYNSLGLRQPGGSPASELDTRSGRILSELVLLNLLLLVVTTILSYLLARRTLRPIARAHEQQKRFTADVSHELRTPLTSLKMETEVALLDTGIKSQELRSVLRSNLEEVERMEALINNLLTLSTVEAGKLQAKFLPLNLEELLTSAIDTVKPLADRRSIVLTHTPSRKPPAIYGDKASLTQLAIILLENGVKYSPEGAAVTIEYITGRGRSGFRMTDEGSGISTEALPHIFDRFYRADSSRTSGATQGFGLGLSLAKLIADLHDAEIIISSAEGQGTVVEVKFN